MATTTDMRRWLRDQGEDVPERGRLRPELVARYEAAHDADAEWDMADLEDVGLADADEFEPSVPMQPERPPRTARTVRAERRAQPVTKRASGVLGKLLGEDKKKDAAKKGKKIPRTSLERLISRGYSEVGKILAPLSQPMSRCLQAQATFAGIVWEDTLRDTIVDRALQPAARAEEKLDKMFALVATPAAVLAAERNQLALAMQQITPQQFMVRQAFVMPVLREGLRKTLEISETYAEQIKEKIERDARWDAEIDAMLAMIFEPPEEQAAQEPEMAGAAA